MSCYSGPNPIGKLTDRERLAMWKWVKENAIDHGMPIEQVRETFNNHYFGGAAKEPWLNEFLAARKTPFKRASDAAWAAQANRRNIQSQAKQLVKNQNSNILAKAADMVIAGPRYVTLGGGFHFAAFPFTHGGALTLNPLRWKAFGRLVFNTWRNAFNKGEAEILRDTMARDPRFTLAQRSKLDFSTHGNESGGGKINDRAWAALVETRFRLWQAAMDRHTKPGMSTADIDSLGTQLALWANHATGSGEGVFTASRYLSKAFFGPKLTQSYWNRLVGDPLKTISTWVNWSKATPGEKAVAQQRLQGAVAAAVTYSGMLYANQAMLAATGQKDQINWNDPSKSDWLAFKGWGFRWGIPGAMHAEIKLIGQIIAAQNMTPEDLAAQGMQVGKGRGSPAKLQSLRDAYRLRQIEDYFLNKATPAIKLGQELWTGKGFPERPLPWNMAKQTPAEAAKHPRMSWGEYAWSHAPIPLESGAQYVFEQLRKAGMSVGDASMWIRAAVVSAISFAAGEGPKAVKDSTPHRTRYGHAQVGR
jgi:hypothetical protein